MKTITRITNSFTSGVQHEIDSVQRFKEDHEKLLNMSSTAEEYFSNKETSSIASEEYRVLMEQLPKDKMKILDIGVGMGQSSIYLGYIGHQVCVIEPVPSFCKTINEAATKFNLDISVFEGVAEDILDMNMYDFDIVFFNSSFHHCDDPARALSNVFMVLKPNGVVVMASENFLPFWTTKKKWHYLMNNYPVEMGHYGGNEHVYYSWEYVRFLKRANFRNIKIMPLTNNLFPIDRFEHILTKKINGKRVYNENRLLIRFIYYVLIARLLKSKLIFALLFKCSIVPGNLIATKQP